MSPLSEPSYTGKGKAVESIMSPRSTPSAFFRLPAELRNRIYELVLQQSSGIRIDEDHDMIDQPENLLAITKVCWQTQNEARLMLYSVNTFLVDFNFVFWLRNLGDDQREAITSIEFLMTLPARLSNGVWSGAPVRQHDNYVAMVLRVLPGLRHINMAVTLQPDHSVAGSVPEEADVRCCLEPFKISFEQSTTGVRITTTTTFQGRVV